MYILLLGEVDEVPSACPKMSDVAFWRGASLVIRQGKEPDCPSTMYKPFLPDLHWPLK